MPIIVEEGIGKTNVRLLKSNPLYSQNIEIKQKNPD